MDEKIIQISYADGAINPTILTSSGRVLKAVVVSASENGPIEMEWRDITPIVSNIK